MRLLLLVAACSFTFDPNAPDIRLVGGPPPPPGGPSVAYNDEAFNVIPGADGAPWVVLYPSVSMAGFQDFTPLPPAVRTLRIARLTAPAHEETLSADSILVHDQRLYIFNPDANVVHMTTRLIGGAGETQLTLPAGYSLFEFSGNAFFHWLKTSEHIDIFRSDGSFARSVPSPTDSNSLQSLELVENDAFLLELDSCNPFSQCSHAFSHSTTDGRDFDLGLFGLPSLEPTDILACDVNGLRRVPYDGSAPTVIDSAACNGLAVAVPGHILECNANGLVDHPLDGSPARSLGAVCSNLSVMGFNGKPPSWQITHRDDYDAQPTILCGTPGIFLAPADGSPLSWLDAAPCDDIRYSLLDHALLRCAYEGLRAVPYDHGAGAMLDDHPCADIWSTGEDYVAVGSAGSYTLEVRQADVWYTANGLIGDPPPLTASLQGVPLDGSDVPRVLLASDGHKRVFERKGLMPPMYTLDPPGQYWQPVSDGWLGDWRFMERGWQLQASLDRSRLRWIDHAARVQPVGDLFSSSLTARDVVPLARNVRQFLEVSPGKLLVADNQPSLGPQNRIILIDEASKTARWVVNGADQFREIFFGGTLQLLVEQVSEANEKSLVLMPLPY